MQRSSFYLAFRGERLRLACGRMRKLYLCRVGSLSKEKLWSPVPECHHLDRVVAVLVGQLFSGKSEVGQLDLSLFIHQNIGDFQIAVDDGVIVQVLGPLQYLPHDGFQLRVGKFDLELLDPLEIVLHIIENQKRAAPVVVPLRRLGQ